MARPAGSPNKDKPYREALRMELAAAGDDMKELRVVARAHITAAKGGDMQAIKEMADRLDGKPAQESTVTYRQEVTALTDEEIIARIAELRGTGASGDNTEAPVNKAQLN